MQPVRFESVVPAASDFHIKDVRDFEVLMEAELP